VLRLVIPNEYVPSPRTALDTSSATQLPTTVLPAAAISDPSIGGAVDHVIVDSAQLLETLDTWPPSGLASVTYIRSVADETGPVRPATSKRMYER
jgi:hypothetical protein